MITIIVLCLGVPMALSALNANSAHRHNDHAKSVYHLLFALFWAILWSVAVISGIITK